MSTLTFKVTLPQGRGQTTPINVVGTDLVIDYGDGTTTEQSPDTDGIYENHGWQNLSSPTQTWTIIITGNITGLGDSFLEYGGSVTEITLPTGLQSIGNRCLNSIYAEEIIIPSTVSSIGNYFLNNSHIKKIEIQGEQLTTVGYSFMKGCSEVTSIKLPNSLTMLGGQYSFNGCSSLKEFEVPPLVTEWPYPCFQNVTLEKLKFPKGPIGPQIGINTPPISENTKIIIPRSELQNFINHTKYPNERARYILYGENLAEKIYVLGDAMALNLTNKGVNASANDGLTTLAEKINDVYANIPRVIIEDDTVTDFADLRFTVITPANCLKIAINSFTGCNNLVRCIIQEGPTFLETSAFSNCSNLQIVELPSTIRSLNAYVFSNLPSLHTLTFKSLNPPALYNSGQFNSLPTTCTIRVPQASLSLYKSATGYPDPNTYTYVGY